MRADVTATDRRKACFLQSQDLDAMLPLIVVELAKVCSFAELLNRK